MDQKKKKIEIGVRFQRIANGNFSQLIIWIDILEYLENRNIESQLRVYTKRVANKSRAGEAGLNMSDTSGPPFQISNSTYYLIYIYIKLIN